VRTGRDLSPLLDQSPPTGLRPPYHSPALPGLVAVAWLLVAAALLAQSAYLNGLTIATVAAAAVAALFSLFWLQRAYRNLSALGVPELRDSPVSAAVWFVVPVANWILTYPVLSDLWRLSDRSDPHGLSQRRPLLVQAWWLCWAAPPVISILSLLFFERPGPGSAGDRAQALLSVDLALLAAAAVLAAAIILGVNARQAASHRMQRDEGKDAGL
jgi:Domain of unknown function (DUF4328)